MRARLVDSMLDPMSGQRILGADVQVAALAAGGQGGDGHRLDDGERIALHQDPVFEGAWLRLVGVRDQVVRTRGGPGHRVPLASGRKGGASAAQELRVGELADHPLRTQLQRAPEGRIAARGAIAVEALGIDLAGAAQQAELAARLRDADRFSLRPLAAIEHLTHHFGFRVSDAPLHVAHSRSLHQHRRCLIAQPQAGAPVPGGPAVRAGRS